MSSLDRLFQRISNGPIRQRWHWLGYDFTPGTDGARYFGTLTLQALDTVDRASPGYAETMIRRLEGRGGREKDPRDYEAIKAWLSELLVAVHLVRHKWTSPASFTMEPSIGTSRKNPELLVKLDGTGSLGVEVKCPSLSKLSTARSGNPWQVLARLDLPYDDLDGEVTLPADNKLKDHLESANDKFAGFRANDPHFRSVLAVVWDDYINEPISALLSPSSGLLTANSYYRDDSGRAVTFPNVDSILLVRHQHQFVRGMANRPALDDRRHFLDFGEVDAFPPHALIINPAGSPMGQHWVEALHGWPLGSLQHMAEYQPAEIVIWT